MHIYDIIQEVRSISSTNAKLDFLRLNMHGELANVIKSTYSSEYVYGIKKIPDYEYSGFSSYTLTDLLTILKIKFATNEWTGNRRVEELQHLLSSTEPKNAEVLKMVISGSLDCGVSTTGFNKVLGDHGTIPTFSTMLCAKQDQKLIDSLDFENDVVVQTKMDGMRVIVSVDTNRHVRYRTRNGKEFFLPVSYNEYFAQFPGLCFDGEMLIEDGEDYLTRSAGNGLLNSIRQGKASYQDANRLRFIFWDCIKYEDYFVGKSPVAYTNRFDNLCNLIMDTFPMSSICRVVDSYGVSSFEEAQHIYMNLRAQGEEGVIIKSLSADWSASRVKHQIKMKAEETMDLRVIDVQPGSGKFKGMLGAVICTDASGTLEVKVGSGFNDDQRKEYWENSIIGNIIEVKYNEVIQSKGKEKPSLFLPIFVALRDDKTECDIL